MITVKSILLVGMMWTHAIAADYCSLYVQVADSSGPAITGVSVTVREADGRTESKVVENGGARFCDLGVLPVAVAVGSPAGCDYTVVHNVALILSATRQLQVLYNRAACRADELPPTYLCRTMLRFSDESGKWVPGLQFNPPLPHDPDGRSDASGRVLVRLGNHEHLRVKTEKSGYAPETIELDCSAASNERERMIRLRQPH